MQANESNVVVIPNGNAYVDRLGYKPRYVILHGTAGGSSAPATANYFASTQNTGNPVSSHYVIGQDGTVVQCVPEKDGAWANGVLTAGHDSWWDPNINPNNITISIEHCKPSSDNSDALTPAQQASSFALIKHICQRWGIPMRAADASGGITSHASIDPVNRSRCPGNYPWNALWTYLQEEETMSIDLSQPDVAAFFEANGEQWHCKTTNCILMGGILDFYRSYGGNGLCGLTYLGLPLTNEIVLNSVPNHPEITIQRFERGVLTYDPNHKLDSVPGAGPIYPLHLDREPGQDPRVSQLLQDKAGLESQLAQAKQTPAAPDTDSLKAFFGLLKTLEQKYGA